MVREILRLEERNNKRLRERFRLAAGVLLDDNCVAQFCMYSVQCKRDSLPNIGEVSGRGETIRRLSWNVCGTNESQMLDGKNHLDEDNSWAEMQ